jgi:hypothetical protein
MLPIGDIDFEPPQTTERTVGDVLMVIFVVISCVAAWWLG